MSLRETWRGLRNRLASGSFLASVAAVSGSTLAVQAISLVAAPVTARLYTPADHGLLALFSSCFSLLTLLATLRYEAALPLARDDREAAHLLALGGLLTLALTALVALVCLAFPQPIADLLAQDARVGQFLWFLPLGVLLPAAFNLLTAGAVRSQQFGTLAQAKVTQAVAGAGTSIGLGFAQVGVVGLMAGTLATWVVGLRTVGRGVLGALREQWSALSWAGLKEVARLHYRFPLYNTGAQLVNAASLQLPVFLLSAYASAAATGWFALTFRMLLLPTVLISGAITPVFYSRAREAREDGSLREFTERMLGAIGGVNAFFVVFVALFGEPLFALVFGEAWTRSGTYAAVMAPWLLVNFMVTPLATLPLVFHRQGMDFFFHAALLVLRASAMLGGLALGGDLPGVAAFSAASALCILAYLAWILRLVKVPFAPVLARLSRELALALVMLGACRLVWSFSDGSLLWTGMALAPVLGFGAWRALRQLKTLA